MKTIKYRNSELYVKVSVYEDNETMCLMLFSDEECTKIFGVATEMVKGAQLHKWEVVINNASLPDIDKAFEEVNLAEFTGRYVSYFRYQLPVYGINEQALLSVADDVSTYTKGCVDLFKAGKEAEEQGYDPKELKKQLDESLKTEEKFRRNTLKEKSKKADESNEEYGERIKKAYDLYYKNMDKETQRGMREHRVKAEESIRRMKEEGFEVIENKD